MITLKQITYFDALSRTLHFGRAAERVNVSQPALSAQIAELEAQLGCLLVERRRGAIVLSENGQRLLPSFRRVLAEVRSIEEQVQQQSGVLTGRMRIGMIPTLAPYLLPALAPELSRRFPQLDFGVREAITETLVAQLRSGDLDVVIAAMPIREAGLSHRLLFEDRFVMAVSNNDHDILDSPLNRHKAAFDRLLLLEEGHCLRDQALSVCHGQSQGALVNFGATSLTTLLQMVAHGMGRTLLPEIAVSAESPRLGDIRFLPFAPPAPSRQIAMFFRTASERQGDYEALASVASEIGLEVLTAGRSRMGLAA
ncbi:LysR substrate-binding domain-containing protein [Hoeflea sp.]|uniref:hydrogen peroxide-inducible genes activator n=1 Tax=Hoeflea sp. TaxID=1940281 RepID=UPI003BB02677